jgi:iron complex outermembrane receptor protein
MNRLTKAAVLGATALAAGVVAGAPRARPPAGLTPTPPNSPPTMKEKPR